MTELDPATAPAEPLVSLGVWVSAATAVIALLVAFGLPLSNAQEAAILAVVAFVAPIVTALAGRGRVFSPKTVARLLAAARTRPESL